MAENLVAHTMAIKFEGDSMKLPYGVGYIIGQTYNMAFVFAFLLPFYIERRKNTKTIYSLSAQFYNNIVDFFIVIG